MIIEYDKNLKEQRIYANGSELASIMGLDKDENGNRIFEKPETEKILVATIKNPVLNKDLYRLSKLNSTDRDIAETLYGGLKTKTIYNGTELDFEQGKYKGVWGPSIDTILFCKGLNEIDLNNVKNVIEIGCGSGFISKYIINNAKNLEKIDLIDLNEYALKCAQDNIRDNRTNFVIGNAIKYITGKKYDLVVCNPPYIDRPESICDNPFEGVKLLNYIITSLDTILNKEGKFITNVSSLSGETVAQTINQSNVNTRDIISMEVPLKVYNVLKNEEWMNFLKERKLFSNSQNPIIRELRKFADKHGIDHKYAGYDYWQKITIKEITPK